MNYIYILKQKEFGWCKVGKTTNPSDRIFTLEQVWGKFDEDSLVYQIDDNLEQSLDNIETTIHRSLIRKNHKISMINEDRKKDGYTEFFKLSNTVEESIDFLYENWIISKLEKSEYKKISIKSSIVKSEEEIYIKPLEKIILEIQDLKYLNNESFNLFEIKFLTYLKTKILSNKEKEITIETKDIIDLGIKRGHFKRQMDYTLYRLESSFLLNIKGVFYPLIKDYTFEKYSKTMTIHFNKRVLKRFKKKSNRISNKFKIPKYSNKYSVIFYKFISTKKENEITLSIEEYRKLLGIPNTSYKNTFELERKVTKKILSEINQKSNLNIQYEKIKKSREVTNIKFFVN